MLDAIYIAMSALHGYQRGLRVIANNTANLNTPGFKGSTLRFADMFYSGDRSGRMGQYGFGLNTMGTVLDFQQGQLQNTGNSLDLAVDGLGLFVLRDKTTGQVHYTRDGQFGIDADGFLVSTTTGEQVMALDASGNLSPVTIASLRSNAGQATANITFRGNLSSTMTTNTVGSVTVIDRAGSSHTLSVKFDAVSGTPGAWDVTLLDGATTVGTSRLTFTNGQPGATGSKLNFTYQVAGQADIPLTLDFSTNVTSFDSGSVSTLTMGTQDGHAPGSLTGTSFDTTGTLVLAYSNGQTVRGVRLALARFASLDAVEPVGDNAFEERDGERWEVGYAGADGFGQIRSGVVEVSNVDLSQQFSDLVIMQRGFQASSQVLSTANEMLAELLGMRGK